MAASTDWIALLSGHMNKTKSLQEKCIVIRRHFGNRASPVYRAHIKRPYIKLSLCCLLVECFPLVCADYDVRIVL